jgi:hypothetical protein
LSTILKALRRLEQERARPLGGRPLREEVAAAAAVTRARGPWKLAAAALAAGISLGVLGLLLWPGGGLNLLAAKDPSPTADASVAAAPGRGSDRSPALPAPAAGPERRPGPPAPFEPDAAASGPPPEAFASDVEVVERPAPKPLVGDGEVRSPRPPRAGQLPPHIEAMLARSEGGSTPSEPPKPVSAPAVSVAAEPTPKPTVAAPESEIRPPAPVAEAPPAPPAPLAEAPPAPPAPLAEAPPAPPAIPEVRVEKTVWHPDPKRREAVISVSGREGAVRVHEGDRLGLLVVSEIEPTGVRFTHRGVALERRVGRAD